MPVMPTKEQIDEMLARLPGIEPDSRGLVQKPYWLGRPLNEALYAAVGLAADGKPLPPREKMWRVDSADGSYYYTYREGPPKTVHTTDRVTVGWWEPEERR